MQSIADFLAAAIRTTTPIALATLACTITENAGVINIGIEGSMVFSAFVAAVAAFYTGSPWLGMLAGMLAGVFIAGILAVLAVICNGQQIVIGIGLNLLGPGLAYLTMEALWGNNGISPWLPGFGDVNIPVVGDIPLLGTILSGHDPTIYLCVALVIVMSFVIYRTRYGLRVRAAGEHPEAVATVGLNVYRLRISAVLLGGLMVGLAGASLCLGAVNVFTNGMSAGRGFLAFAANQFGRWTPAGGYFASLLFGSMEALRIRLQTLGISPQLLQMLPYLTTLVALTISGSRMRAPAANGAPYPHPISLPRPRKKPAGAVAGGGKQAKTEDEEET